MAKYELRIQARKLRKKGISIKSIAETLGVSKSSASVWCSDVKLTKKQHQKLINNAIRSGSKGRLIGANFNKKKKQDNIKFYKAKALKQINKISTRDVLIAVTALYWAEGSKSDNSSGFLFINSDPHMILLVKYFLNSVFEVKNEDIVCTIQINRIHEDRIDKVLKFWSDLLRLPLSQFNKTYYINVVPRKVYENYDTYYGILRMNVKRSSNLKYHILGLIEALKMPV